MSPRASCAEFGSALAQHRIEVAVLDAALEEQLQRLDEHPARLVAITALGGDVERVAHGDAHVVLALETVRQVAR